MKKGELEEKVRGLIDGTKLGHKVEDATIELKTKWPANAYAAARQLAGHANAARGEPILWVIGVDENGRQVVHVEQKELANWMSQVASCFENEEESPTLLLNLSVRVDGETVVALYFETDRMPYVVRNPTFGKEKGCPVQYEVPWREGNSIRTATHADLLRLLLPVRKRPLVDVLYSTMTFNRFADHQEQWRLDVELYAVPMDDTVVVLPKHLWVGEFFYVLGDEWLPLEMDRIITTEDASEMPKTRIRFSEPIRFAMCGETTFQSQTESVSPNLRVRIRLGIAAPDSLPVELDYLLGNMIRQPNGSIIWETGDRTRRDNPAFSIFV